MISPSAPLRELTLGQEFPLPAIDEIIIELILDLLQKAYDGLKADYPEAVSAGDEVDLNALMVERLSHLVDGDPGISQLVRAVSRGTEMLSFDASSLEKRPDIQISLTSRRHTFPLIVECKLIDQAKRKTISLYCEHGLARFTLGNYAWTNREALMLAYVRDSTSTSNVLRPFLAKAMRCRPPEFAVVKLPEKCAGLSNLQDACRSDHERCFSYVHGEQHGHLPGNIAVWHLWVS